MLTAVGTATTTPTRKSWRSLIALTHDLQRDGAERQDRRDRDADEDPLSLVPGEPQRDGEHE